MKQGRKNTGQLNLVW